MFRHTVRILKRTRASIVPAPVEKTYTLPTPKAPYEARAWKPMSPPKTPYVIRPFIRDAHLEDLQHVENRGMYQEELDIERARHPKFVRSMVVRTDGSLDEVEFEYTVPPILVLFNDRPAAHHAHVARMALLGSAAPSRNTWDQAAPPPPPSHADDEADAGDVMWNVVEFPFCVPRKVTPRPVHNVNFDGDTRPSWGGDEQPS